jgi:hypothetical protein
MTIAFEYEVVRVDDEGAEHTITLAVECSVSKSYEEEGHSFFVSILSATDWDGNEIDLTRREHDEVEDIAVDIFTGDR